MQVLYLIFVLEIYRNLPKCVSARFLWVWTSQLNACFENSRLLRGAYIAAYKIDKTPTNFLNFYQNLGMFTENLFLRDYFLRKSIKYLRTKVTPASLDNEAQAVPSVAKKRIRKIYIYVKEFRKK